VRDPLKAVLDALVAAHAAAPDGHRPVVDLDVIADAIGSQAVSYEDVDALVDALEAAGLRVGELPSEIDVAFVRELVGVARALQREGGRPPSLGALAARVGRHPVVVRAALRWATRAR